MTTIAVTNRKGGVGKTTTATNLSCALATVGYRVGIIDTDSQGHISASLSVPRQDSLFDILVDD
ncbi:MAG: ParA family protein, partial [Chloroflexota bacterium]